MVAVAFVPYIRTERVVRPAGTSVQKLVENHVHASVELDRGKNFVPPG